ncbi:MAG: UDP-N-acetylmuramate dehydrogenase, partial [Candidatus Aminicenantes bacterium]|nr:UDP-N-acetylmuramate dehydrogenase [Candidatus Aminicenantes bacterium]
MDARDEFPLFFEAALGKTLSRRVALAPFSSFRIGGPADFFFEAVSAEDLKKAAQAARAARVPFYLIGDGTNLLFADEGYRGLVVRNRAAAPALDTSLPRLAASSGLALGKLVQFSLEKGLTGMEFLAGIPGTVGAAVCGNAGAFSRSIGDVLEAAFLLDRDGGERRAGRADLGFSYRHSSLREKGDIVLSSVFSLAPGDPARSRDEVREILEQRKKKHPPWGTACAGSYFKNPCLPDGSKQAAGYLLDQAGARGERVGDAAVYEGHCNFIINLGRASARDVLELAA